jgi:hypothetical protein
MTFVPEAIKLLNQWQALSLIIVVIYRIIMVVGAAFSLMIFLSNLHFGLT